MCPHLPPPLHLLLVFCSAAKSLFTISLLCISHPYFGKFKTRFGTWDSWWKSSYGNPNLFLGLSFVNKSQQAAHVSGSSVIQKALRYIWELSKRSQVIFFGFSLCSVTASRSRVTPMCSRERATCGNRGFWMTCWRISPWWWMMKMLQGVCRNCTKYSGLNQTGLCWNQLLKFRNSFPH